MAASMVVVAASYLNMASVELYIFIVHVDVPGIELILKIFYCFNESLKFSGLVGCGV